jgi:hypothetical protein
LSNITLSIATGVLSGVITTAFLFIMGKLFYKLVLPWYQNIKYQGVDLEGDWVSELKHGSNIAGKFKMTIQQNAHDLSGTIVCTQGPSPEDTETTLLNLTGITWEGFVTLNIKSIDRKRLSFGTSLLRVTHGGLTLTGIYAYRCLQSDEVEWMEIEWSKVE